MRPFYFLWWCCLPWFARWLGPRDAGLRGEWWAAVFLRAHGLRVLFWRQRVGRDEWDLIALQGRRLVFVEVKTWRRRDGTGSPLEAVDHQKQVALARAAARFVHQHNLHELALRFDVVAVRDVFGRRPVIEWIPAAFEDPRPGPH